MYRSTAALALIASTACAAPDDAIVIRDVTVIPMTGETVLPAHTVVVEGDRIAALGPTATVEAPRGARVVDGAGRYLIPGLFEMHGHTSKSRASALDLYVVHGVTTLRDMGSEHAEVLRWRREIGDGDRVGPRMVIAGPYLESLRNIERMRRDPPAARVEPFERARIAVATPEDARRIIDSLAALALDFFKIRTVEDRATYLAINAAADAHGLRVVGHIPTASPALFLESGQDGVEHGFVFLADSLQGEQGTAFWRALAERDIGVVPTLVTIPASVFQSGDYFQRLVDDPTAAVHPMRPYLSKFMTLDWREQAAEATPERRAFFESAWREALAQVRKMHDAGVPIMAGSDVAVLNIFPGWSLHDELRLFVDSVGMTPLEALASATREPARWLGFGDSLGTVAAGNVADLVLLDANPLDDITNTRRIAAVVLRGRLFDRGALDSLLAKVAAAADIGENDWRR